MDATISEFDLKIRYQIYRFFAEECRPPSLQELARSFNVTEEAIKISFQNLHKGHMIFLDPEASTIRMANPFSAIPTNFRVRSGQKEWWANCAWDTLGIPAALNIDVDIEAPFSDNQENVKLQVRNGIVDGKNYIVCFPLPCRQWYDDLVFT
jgi:hypothetical protein